MVCLKVQQVPVTFVYIIQTCDLYGVLYYGFNIRTRIHRIINTLLHVKLFSYEQQPVGIDFFLSR